MSTLSSHLIKVIPHVFQGMSVRADQERDCLLITNGTLAFAITHAWLDSHDDGQGHDDGQIGQYVEDGCKGILQFEGWKEKA